MPRIAGVDIPEDKKILYSLQYVYGIGHTTAESILQTANVDPDKRTRDLTGEEISRIQRAVEQYETEGDLRRRRNDNVDRLKRIGSYRGDRHKKNLPVRGQRTRTNARTNRGRRQTVGSVTKEEKA
jgi:small subunit ribosomal protein S13